MMQIVVGALQIGGREEHHREHDPREGENEQYEQAGHERTPMQLSQKITGHGSAGEYSRV